MPRRLVPLAILALSLAGPAFAAPAVEPSRAALPAAAASTTPAAAPRPAPPSRPHGVLPPDAAQSVQALVRQARYLLQRNRPDLANLVLLKAIAVNPDDAQVLLLLAEIALRDNREAEVAAYTQEMQRRHPGSDAGRQLDELHHLYTVERLRLQQLRALRREDRTPEAATLARQLFRGNRAPGLLGDEFNALLAGTVTAAARGTGAGLPDPAVQARLRGYVALDEGRLDRAEAEFQRALRFSPADAAALGGLGIVRLRQERYADARTLLGNAAARERGDAGTWRTLGATARYWDDVGRARHALANGRLAEADTLLSDALPLQPDQVEAHLLLAELRTRQQRPAEAERLYAEALARNPREARALRGRLALRLAAATPDTLEAAVDEAVAVAQQLQVPPGDVLDGEVLRAGAARLAEADRPAAAQRLLERGLALEPANPWLRHDLARRLLAQGQPERALALMAEGRERAPQDGTTLYTGALVALAAGREDLALELLQRIPPGQATPSHAELADTAGFEMALRHYRDALAAGDRPGVEHALVTARRHAGDIPARRLRLARAEQGAGQADRALAELDAIDPRPLSDEDALAWADVAIELDRDAQAEPVLARLAATPGSAAWRDGVIEAQQRLAERRIARALQAEPPQHDRARRIAAEALAAWTTTEPVPRAARLAQAELWLAAGHPAAALTWLQAQLRADPHDVDAHLLHVRALAADGQRRAAQRELDALLVGHAGDARIHLEAARLARAAGDHDGAMAHLRRASAAQAPAGGAAAPATLRSVQAAMAELEARRQGRIEAALSSYSTDGDAGIDRLNAVEMPLAVTLPWGYGAHVFARADLVMLDSGELPAAFAASRTYGTVLNWANASPGVTGFAQPQAQRDSGANLGLGWEDDRRRIDLGVTGLGMPVHNVVGGWRQRFDTPELGLTLDVSRRAETSSRLAYAGARDPVTGAVWGGVTNTSASVRIDTTLPHRVSLSSTLRAGWMDGRHVQRNRYVRWRGVVDRDWYRGDGFTVNAGVAAMAWRYAHNSSDETYGQGGYYSPQRYFSLGLPVEVAGRSGSLSYLVRGTLAHTWSHNDAAPYYPLDPLLQNAAANGNPTHAADGNRGLGGALRAALEWRLDAAWVAGAALDIERSTDYAPNRASLYVRRYFKPRSDTPAVPPQPLAPYSQF